MKQRLAFLFLLITTVFTVFAQSDLQPLATVSVGKTETINLKQLKNKVKDYETQTKKTSFTLDEKKQILDAMINEKLVIQAAKQDNISIGSAQVDQAFIQSISQQVGKTVTQAEFADLVKQQTGQSLDEFFIDQVGMDVASFKENLKNQLIVQQYIYNLEKDQIQADSQPTDDEIHSYYEINKTSFSQNDILKIFLVVVSKDAGADVAKQHAEELYNQLKNNTVTIDEVKIKSQADDANYQAGDMYVSKGATAAEQLGIDYNSLLNLFKNEVGFVSNMNETSTDFQFYIIRKKYDAKMLELSDVVQPDKTVTVYEYIRNVLTQQKQQTALQTALDSVTKKLRIPGNFKMLKSDQELNTLLDW